MTEGESRLVEDLYAPETLSRKLIEEGEGVNFMKMTTLDAKLLHRVSNNAIQLTQEELDGLNVESKMGTLPPMSYMAILKTPEGKQINFFFNLDGDLIFPYKAHMRGCY